MMGYIAQGNLNIRIHRDITGDNVVWGIVAWGGVDIKFPISQIITNKKGTLASY